MKIALVVLVLGLGVALLAGCLDFNEPPIASFHVNVLNYKSNGIVIVDIQLGKRTLDMDDDEEELRIRLSIRNKTAGILVNNFVIQLNDSEYAWVPLLEYCYGGCCCCQDPVSLINSAVDPKVIPVPVYPWYCRPYVCYPWLECCWIHYTITLKVTDPQDASSTMIQDVYVKGPDIWVDNRL